MALQTASLLEFITPSKKGPNGISKKQTNIKKIKDETIKAKLLEFSKGVSAKPHSRSNVPPKVLMVVKKNEK